MIVLRYINKLKLYHQQIEQIVFLKLQNFSDIFSNQNEGTVNVPPALIALHGKGEDSGWGGPAVSACWCCLSLQLQPTRWGWGVRPPSYTVFSVMKPIQSAVSIEAGEWLVYDLVPG